MHRLVRLCDMLANLCIYAFYSLNVNYERRRITAMKLIEILLIIIAFFLSLAFLVHICSKNKYILRYYSKKRKIEIRPIHESHQTHR